MAEARVQFVVPCYNEANRLPADSFRAFAAANADYRFLFVNDGSTDATQALLDSLHDAAPVAFAVHELEQNSGKAEAVRRGLLLAIDSGAPFVGYLDADLATPLCEVPQLRNVVESRPQVDMVLGSRVRLLGRAIARRPLRHYLGRVFATLASATLGLAVYDTQCGAKLLRVTDHLRAVLQETFQSRWIFDVELMARLIERYRGDQGATEVEARFYEVPLAQWKDVEGSKVRSRDFIVAARELWQIRRRYGTRK